MLDPVRFVDWRLLHVFQLIFVWFSSFFLTLSATLCVPSLDSSTLTTTPSHLDHGRDFAPCSFVLFLLVRTHNHSRFLPPFFLSLIDRIAPSVAPTPTSHVLGLVWSATSTRSPFAYMYFVQPRLTPKPVCQFWAFPLVSIRIE